MARTIDHGSDRPAYRQVADHRLLVGAGGRMRGKGLPHRLMGGDGGLLACPVGGAGDQPLLDRQEVGGGPAALLQGPVGDHTDRPLGQEPVRQRLELAPSGADQTRAQGDQDLGAVKVDACSVSPSGPAKPSNSRTSASADTLWSWSRLDVRPVTSRTRVSGSCPRWAAS